MKISHEMSDSEKLKTIIQQTKWTQSQLATVLGVGQKTMSFWIREVKKPSSINSRNIDFVFDLLKKGELDNNPNAQAIAKAIINDNKHPKDTENKKLTSTEYFEAKNYVREQERDNLSKIFLFPSINRNDEDWYKVGGRSLLFYKFFLAERMGRRVNTRTDTDTQYVFKHGIGSVRNGSSIVSQAAQLGYSSSQLKNRVIVIDLGHKFNEKELANFVEREKIERQTVENIVKPKYNYPKLAMAIRTLAEYLPQKVEKIAKENREILGRQLMEPAVELVKIYHRMANGDMDKADAKYNMLCRVDDIVAVITFMDAGRILDLKARTRLGQNVIDVRHQIEDTL